MNALRIPTPNDYVCLASWIPDAAACLRWAGPRVPFPFSVSELPQLLALAGGASYCLGDSGDEPLGFGQYEPRPGNSVHLMRIIVSPVRRGAGLGRELCSQLISRALAATGAASVTLNVYRDNNAAVSLYESLGFRPEGPGPSDDLLFMRMPAPGASINQPNRWC
jgi:[ribosomal protein S18]-alanine N-acetyltransferase